MREWSELPRGRQRNGIEIGVSGEEIEVVGRTVGLI